MQTNYPKMGVYKLTNNINHKIYIGKSVNLPKRLYNHKYDISCQLIARAIQKYGWTNFTITILEGFDKINPFLLLKKESEWIKKLHATDKNIGYNLAHFSHDRTGLKCSNITKRKLSVFHKGRWVGAKSPWYGHHHSRASIHKMRKPRSTIARMNITAGNQNKNLRAVEQLHLRTSKIIKIWPSIKEASIYFNTVKKQTSLISSVISGAKNKRGYPYLSAYGYKWRYH